MAKLGGTLGGELFTVALGLGLPSRSYRLATGPQNKPQLIQAILASQAGMSVEIIEEQVIAPMREAVGVRLVGVEEFDEVPEEAEEERPPPPAQ